MRDTKTPHDSVAEAQRALDRTIKPLTPREADGAITPRPATNTQPPGDGAAAIVADLQRQVTGNNAPTLTPAPASKGYPGQGNPDPDHEANDAQ